MNKYTGSNLMLTTRNQGRLHRLRTQSVLHTTLLTPDTRHYVESSHATHTSDQLAKYLGISITPQVQ